MLTLRGWYQINLPRDSGTCTRYVHISPSLLTNRITAPQCRCPTEVRLQHAESWSCKITLRFQFDSRGQPLEEVHESDFGPVLYDKRDVEKTLRRAQRAILRPSLNPSVFLDDTDLTLKTPMSSDLSFSANCICIRVSGENVPDLYFYDLPGQLHSLLSLKCSYSISFA